jgi:hypothetical protein
MEKMEREGGTTRDREMKEKLVILRNAGGTKSFIKRWVPR